MKPCNECEIGFHCNSCNGSGFVKESHVDSFGSVWVPSDIPDDQAEEWFMRHAKNLKRLMADEITRAEANVPASVIRSIWHGPMMN